VKLGILDFGEVQNGRFELSRVIEYAILAEKSNFLRFWITEHYTGYHVLWYNPEVIVPLICAYTNQISVGFTGPLLNVHSPYRIALNCKLLENIFPGRIDLGIAKGLPKSLKVVNLLDPSYDPNDSQRFHTKIKELLAFFNKERELIRVEIITPPIFGRIPRVWQLSGSFSNLNIALEHGLNYSKSFFHFGANNKTERNEIMKFRKDFLRVHKKRAIVNCAFAFYYHPNSKISYKELEKQLQFKIDPDRVIVGPMSKIHDELTKFSLASGVNEFILKDMDPNYKNKLRNLELISRIFKLG